MKGKPRSFNIAGRQKFSELLDATDLVKSKNIDWEKFSNLAHNNSYSEIVEGSKTIDHEASLGNSKYTMCNYLHDKLPPWPSVADDHGLWEWLACVYIKNFERTGVYGLGNENKNALNKDWLIMSGKSFYEERHIIKRYIYFYDLYHNHPDKKVHSKVILSEKINILGEIASQWFVNTVPIFNNNFMKFVNQKFFNKMDQQGNPIIKTGLNQKKTRNAARVIKAVTLSIGASYDITKMSYRHYEELMNKNLNRLPEKEPSKKTKKDKNK